MINRTTPALRRTLIEMLLDANCSILLDNYRQNCLNSQSGWGMELRKEINLSISFLMFALGYQVGALISSGGFDVPDGLGAFTIAFGGRGSKILEWRGYERDLLINVFKKGLSKAGAQKTFEVEIEISSSPKCEVARGLLVDRPPEAFSPNPVNIRIDIAKYLNAAESFQEAFNTTFQDAKTKNRPLSDSRKINRNRLAAQIEKAENQEIVNVFMEIIFNCFTESTE